MLFYTHRKEISVLGVVFDSRLCWDNHVEKHINKANKALNAIKLLVQFFNTKELLQLLTSNYPTRQESTFL
jgi:hypothetical protein